MSVALALVNGFPRQQSTAGQAIYDQSILVVASGATPPTSVNGPIAAGTPLTLPNGFSYTLNASGVANITVFFNSTHLEQTYDWLPSGTGPNYTAIQLTFGLVATDRIDVRSERTN